MSPRMINIVMSSLAAGVFLAVMMTVWAFITSHMEGGSLSGRSVVRVFALSFGAGLLFQISYGSLVYIILDKFILYKLVIVIVAYLVPVVAGGFFLADTYGDIIGILPWAVFSVGIAAVGWAFNSGVWRML